MLNKFFLCRKISITPAKMFFFFSNIISMSEYYDFSCFDIMYLTKDKIKH